MRLPLVVLLAALVAACNQSSQVQAIDKLTPCKGDDTPTDAYCGTLKVFENRQTRQGRQIDLNIVVLPALSSEPKPDPLFFLAGGPGQGAAKMAKPIRQMYSRVQTDRDIVLVDQRGTGKSNPLNCESNDESLAAINETLESGLARLKKCMEGYDADLTLYTTTIAMDDLDDVRAFLGYDKINIYGGSYGTRAGLVYMRQHGDHIRAAILDGVAPTNMRLPLFFARDSQRAFDLLLADCESDPGCKAKYPNLAARFRALMERLETAPPLVNVTHPRTGEKGQIRFEARLLANVIVVVLYTPAAAALVPALIDRAEANDVQSVLALATAGDGGEPNMAIGMQLSVICAEDAPKISPEDKARETAGFIFSKYVLQAQQQACGFWPRGTVDDSYYQPVSSNIPTLVMSGQIDPVTPPVWGEEITRHLPNARHIVMPGTGHTAGGTPCGLRIIRSFLDKGSAQDLDTSCANVITRPPFFVSPAGPDPSRTAPAPTTDSDKNLSRRSPGGNPAKGEGG